MGVCSSHVSGSESQAPPEVRPQVIQVSRKRDGAATSGSPALATGASSTRAPTATDADADHASSPAGARSSARTTRTTHNQHAHRFSSVRHTTQLGEREGEGEGEASSAKRLHMHNSSSPMPPPSPGVLPMSTSSSQLVSIGAFSAGAGGSTPAAAAAAGPLSLASVPKRRSMRTQVQHGSTELAPAAFAHLSENNLEVPAGAGGQVGNGWTANHHPKQHSSGGNSPALPGRHATPAHYSSASTAASSHPPSRSDSPTTLPQHHQQALQALHTTSPSPTSRSMVGFHRPPSIHVGLNTAGASSSTLSAASSVSMAAPPAPRHALSHYASNSLSSIASASIGDVHASVCNSPVGAGPAVAAAGIHSCSSSMSSRRLGHNSLKLSISSNAGGLGGNGAQTGGSHSPGPATSGSARRLAGPVTSRVSPLLGGSWRLSGVMSESGGHGRGGLGGVNLSHGGHSPSVSPHPSMPTFHAAPASAHDYPASPDPSCASEPPSPHRFAGRILRPRASSGSFPAAAVSAAAASSAHQLSPPIPPLPALASPLSAGSASAAASSFSSSSSSAVPHVHPAAIENPLQRHSPVPHRSQAIVQREQPPAHGDPLLSLCLQLPPRHPDPVPEADESAAPGADRDGNGSGLVPPLPRLPTMTHSKTVPSNLCDSARRPPVSERASSGQPAPRGSGSSTPTVFSRHIETGLTDDGYVHINQYIVEMSSKKREAIIRREDHRRIRQQQRALRQGLAAAAAAAKEAEAAAAAGADAGSNSSSAAAGSADASVPLPPALLESVTGDASDFSSSSSDEEAEESDSDDDEGDASILGRGSFGVVKKVFNTQDNQFYAMKILSKSLLSRERKTFGRGGGGGGMSDAAAAVRREIAILKRLDHPNVVRLYEVLWDDDDDNLYLVMEYAPGGPIMDVDLTENEVEVAPGEFNILTQPLPLDQARRYFADVLAGLEYLHHNRVIHRDIKPQNLLVAADGRAMIADFGVSTLCEGEECLIASTAGTSVFMSPEMVAAGSRTRGFGGPQTDIWSLGVTLFFFVFGRLPWYSPALPDLYRDIVTAALTIPEGPEYAHVPDELRELLRGMLLKDPKQRWTIEQIVESPWMTAPDAGMGAVAAAGLQGVETSAGASADGAPMLVKARTASTADLYKQHPPVGDTLHPRDIEGALGRGFKRPLQLDDAAASLPPHGVGAIGVGSGGGRGSRLAKLRSRLASWRRDLSRRCEAKHQERAAKRAGIDLLKMQAAEKTKAQQQQEQEQQQQEQQQQEQQQQLAVLA